MPPIWIPWYPLGATAAFGYSTYALFAMTVAQVQGDAMAVMGYMEEFYFDPPQPS